MKAPPVEILDLELANGNFITVEANKKDTHVIVTDAGGNVLGCWNPKVCAGIIKNIMSCASGGENNE